MFSHKCSGLFSHKGGVLLALTKAAHTTHPPSCQHVDTSSTPTKLVPAPGPLPPRSLAKLAGGCLLLGLPETILSDLAEHRLEASVLRGALLVSAIHSTAGPDQPLKNLGGDPSVSLGSVRKKPCIHIALIDFGYQACRQYPHRPCTRGSPVGGSPDLYVETGHCTGEPVLGCLGYLGYILDGTKDIFLIGMYS